MVVQGFAKADVWNSRRYRWKADSEAREEFDNFGHVTGCQQKLLLPSDVRSCSSVKVFVEELRSLQGQRTHSNRRRVERQTYLLFLESSSVVQRLRPFRRIHSRRWFRVSGTIEFANVSRKSHTMKSGQVPHTPGGTLAVG